MDRFWENLNLYFPDMHYGSGPRYLHFGYEKTEKKGATPEGYHIFLKDNHNQIVHQIADAGADFQYPETHYTANTITVTKNASSSENELKIENHVHLTKKELIDLLNTTMQTWKNNLVWVYMTFNHNMTDGGPESMDLYYHHPDRMDVDAWMNINKMLDILISKYNLKYNDQQKEKSDCCNEYPSGPDAKSLL